MIRFYVRREDNEARYFQGVVSARAFEVERANLWRLLEAEAIYIDGQDCYPTAGQFFADGVGSGYELIVTPHV